MTQMVKRGLVAASVAAVLAAAPLLAGAQDEQGSCTGGAALGAAGSQACGSSVE